MDFEFAAFALEHPAAERWGFQRSATRVAEQLQGSLSLSLGSYQDARVRLHRVCVRSGLAVPGPQ